MTSWIPAIPDISLKVANLFYSWGWRGSLLGAAITAVSVVFLYWGTHVRDEDAARQMGHLNREASQQRERAAKLEKDAEGLALDVEKAKRETEIERVKRLELEAKIAPRRLSGEQKLAIEKAGHPNGTTQIIVVSRFLDLESRDFADDLATALSAAHWPSVSRNTNWLGEGQGVVIASIPNGPTPIIAALRHSLGEASIHSDELTIPHEKLGQISPAFQPGVIYLIVGAKPVAG
jgi:hypothetical protein